ncbi:MAG TPA: hypothetical protein DEP84_28835, partial [Chloroflexi bacterium]|nr:hypothetical protein [Chloroflexota bacterium]
MRSPASLAAKGLLGVILSLVALLLLALPALAQAPGPTPGPGDALARFFMFLSLILVGIIILSALLVAFLMWANGQPVPGLSPVLQDLTAREVDAEGRPTGPSNIVKIAVGVGGLVVVVLLVAFVVPAIMSGTQPAAPAVTPT